MVMDFTKTYVSYVALSLAALFGSVAYAELPSNELGKTLEKEMLYADQFEGKVLVLYFWSSKCDGCMDSFSALEGIQDLAGTTKLQVVAVNQSDSRKRFQKSAELFSSAGLIVTRDKSGKIARKFSAKKLPAFIVINAEGDVVSEIIPQRAMKDMPSGYRHDMLKQLVKNVDLAVMQSKTLDVVKN